jgi:threonine/homoserine/homoserine lactone efflux protein
MPAELFLRGLAIGFVVAFALGPIGLLVIRRTIDRGWAYGFVSGVGVATADAAYAAVAAFGLTAITTILVGVDRVLGIAGGAVLVLLAARGLRESLAADQADAPATPVQRGRLDTPPGAWASMVALTLANPATILSFAALFASIGTGTGGPAGAGAVVAGVFAGSVAWWALLTALIAGLRARLTPRLIRWLNVVSALLIGAFGVVAIALGVAG